MNPDPLTILPAGVAQNMQDALSFAREMILQAAAEETCTETGGGEDTLSILEIRIAQRECYWKRRVSQLEKVLEMCHAEKNDPSIN